MVLLNNSHWDGLQGGTTTPIPGSLSNGKGIYSTENSQIGSTEIWEIANLSEDAHPIHLHLIQFQLINRQDFLRDDYRTDWDSAFPAGTFNHFAKDMGIPLDLDQAIATIGRGQVREVDVGEVNGRIFLNNSSIGLYPSAVAQREELRHRHGGGKWPAMLTACVDVFRRYPLLSVTLQAEGRAVPVTTPFIFVGNNRYEMSLFALGTRTSLEGGELSLYLARNGGRWGLLRLAGRALLGRLEQDRDFHTVLLPRLEIHSRRRALRVSLDGEVLLMTSPIRYSLRPRALRVLASLPDPPQDEA
jgi:diacylglycerol kinase family enzyme